MNWIQHVTYAMFSFQQFAMPELPRKAMIFKMLDIILLGLRLYSIQFELVNRPI